MYLGHACWFEKRIPASRRLLDVPWRPRRRCVKSHFSWTIRIHVANLFSFLKLYSLSKDLRFNKLWLLLLLLCSYAYSGRPVIISDALVNWTAKDTFSYNFFRSLYKTSSSRHSRRCQFFPYKTEFRSLEEALSMSNERFTSQPW